ncbi:MAG: O-antigen ligase family protein [Candidatus Desulfacyla sp.]
MEKLSYVLYLTVLLLSILLFGAMHTYVYTLMALGVLAATALLVVKGLRKDHKADRYMFRFPKTALDAGFLVLLGFLALQITPLPAGVIKLISPEAMVVWEKSWPSASLVGGSAGVEAWLSLAPYPYPVRMSIIRLTVYGLFCLGLIRVLNSQKRIQVAIVLVLIMGCFEALYGLIQAYSGAPQVLWFKSGSGRNVAGTYINRNHFAGFMEMGMLLAAAFTAALSERKKSSSDRERRETFRARLADFLSGEQLLNKRILILFAGVVMGIGLIFSASRGGIIAAAGGLLCMSLFLVFRKGQRRKGIIFLALFLIASAYALDIGVDYVAGRFKSIDTAMEGRHRYALKAIEMFEDYKVAGVGVGNFKYAYPKYQAAEDKKVFIRFAHNDWAQFLSEAGIAGMVLLLGCLAYYLAKAIRLWRRRNDPFAVCLGIAPVAALTAIGIHSYSDFNLHIPANVLVLVAIMAIGYAALHLERHHRRDRMNYTYYDLPLRYRGGAVLVLILGLIGWTGWWSVRHFMAESYCNTVPNSTLNRDQNPPLAEVAKAIAWDGGNAEYWNKFAERIGQSAEGMEARSSKVKAESSKLKAQSQEDKGAGEDDSPFPVPSSAFRVPTFDFRLPTSDFRLLALERAVRLNPFEAQYHLRLGWAYAHQWNDAAYHTKWLPSADISMDRAAYFAGVKNPRLHVELGNYWTMRSKSVYPSDPLHHEAWARAVRHYRRAQSAERGAQSGESQAVKEMQKEIRDYVWNIYPDEAYLKEVLIEAPSGS